MMMSCWLHLLGGYRSNISPGCFVTACAALQKGFVCRPTALGGRCVHDYHDHDNVSNTPISGLGGSELISVVARTDPGEISCETSLS